MATRQANQKSSPNTSLIIALIFFIITTLGLGVGTYSGFAIDDNKAEELKKAQAEVKALKADVDWNRFQALLFKSYMGYASDAELADLDLKLVQFGLDKEKGNLDGLGTGSLAMVGGDAKKKEVREDVKPLVALIQDTLQKRVALDPKTAKFEPAKGFSDLIAGVETRVGVLEGKLSEAQTALDTEKKQIAVLRTDKENADATYKTAVATINANKGDKVLEFSTEKKKLEDKLAEVIATSQMTEKAAAEKLKEANDKLDVLSKQVAEYAKSLRERTEEIALLRQRGDNAPKQLRTDWKIVKLAPGGTTAYINLGAADGLTAQQTFSIHGVNAEGKPEQTPKGTAEVLNVEAGHVAEIRIIAKDRQHAPVLEGDVLFNPIWSPNQKKHVALAGIVDLAGDGRDGLPEFIRYLESHGVVVDCYLDPKDLKTKRAGKEIDVKDAITVQTEYLILGPGSTSVADGKEYEPYRTLIDAQIKLIGAQAKEKGVTVLGLPKYLDEVGYRTFGASNAGTGARFTPPVLGAAEKQ